MKFIDLFAGLGGFHLALQQLGHQCVFASEIDRELIGLYERNFGLQPRGDIRQINVVDIPEHEILCAGFPCQPFSKAGEQKGLECDRWGNLFWEIIRITDYHKPEFLLLENVSNLEKHDSGKTWRQMESELYRLGYDVKFAHLSPDAFGIPQVRRRMFIVARRGQNSLATFDFPMGIKSQVSIKTVLDTEPQDRKQIPHHFIDCLEVWQTFITEYPINEDLPTFPIWAMEFGATYPYQETTPFMLSDEELGEYHGIFGLPLADIPAEQRRNYLPHHALTEEEKFPDWKIAFIQRNRAIYKHHQKWIDAWIPSIQKFPHSLQKLEWNCKGAPRDIWQKIIRFRPSGVRVKLPTTAPSLNTIDTQIPIVGWERRFMTMRECARLHGMWDIYLPEMITPAIRALGNAVNVEIVRQIAESLIQSETIQEAVNEASTFSMSGD